MIHVEPQPEPKDFDEKVRSKGRRWLQKHAIDCTAPLPPGTKLYPYWQGCLQSLYENYGGTCAYLAIFFEISAGGGTVEHFVPKSLRPDLAYEWDNYRLACSPINSRKRDFTDVLDPFEVEDDWFYMDFVSGRIFPNPHLEAPLQERIQKTIIRLKLDCGAHREMRARHYQDYCEGRVTAEFLRRQSPFVWKEAERQKLL